MLTAAAAEMSFETWKILKSGEDFERCVTALRPLIRYRYALIERYAHL